MVDKRRCLAGAKGSRDLMILGKLKFSGDSNSAENMIEMP
jgi:hypothetical protein